MNFQIGRVESLAALEALFPEWEALAAQMSPRTPFHSPIWFATWWRHCRTTSLLAQDELCVHTLRNDTGELVAVAPLMITRNPAIGPIRLRTLRFFGADPSITEVSGLVCRLDQQEDVVRALTEYVAAGRGDWDIVIWRGLRDTGRAGDRLAGLAGLQVEGALPCYLINLPESWPKLLAELSSNMRKSLRKAYEFLERDGFKFTFRLREQPEEVKAALECFFSLHAARAGATDMKRHPDRFNTASHRNLIGGVAKCMAERRQLAVLQLEINGSVVATRLAFLLGDELYLYYSGFDPKWRRHSVMTTLMAETIKWAMERGIKVVNLSTGDDIGKSRWRPTEVLYYNAIQVSPTLRGRLVYCAYKALFAVKKLQWP
jgi:CelD/BcsL family acetyltransferase involved in cellulose biosynthesis